MNRSKRIAFGLILFLLPFLLLEIALRFLGIGQGILYVEDAQCGYRPAPSQRFSTMRFPITILTNGYRGPVTSSDTLYVGDSVAYGTAMIRDEETLPALMGGFNAGVNGWGPQNIAAFLQHTDLSGIRRVVWVLPTCDVLRPFMKLRGGLISTNRKMWFRLEYIFRFIWYGKFATQTSPREPSEYEANMAALTDTYEFLRKRGIDMFVVILPYRDEMIGEPQIESPFLAELMRLFDAKQIPYARLLPTGEIQRLYRDGAHLSPEGYRWAASELKKRLPPLP